MILAFVGLAGCLNGAAQEPPRATSNALGDPATSGQKQWPSVFDNSPISYDFDNDGTHEIVAHNDDTHVYVFDLDGTILAKLPTRYPPAWHIERVLNGVEAGVLVPGQAASIVVANHAGYVAAWKFVADGSSDQKFVFQKTWEHRMDACRASPGMDAKPTLADVNKDGSLEILVQTEENGFYALRPDGSVLWKQCWGGGNSAPVAADLDGDGKIEVIVASDAGLVAVFVGATGAPLWTYDARQSNITPASIPTSPTVADLDGKPPLEILFIARDASQENPEAYLDNHMAIFAIRQNLTTWQSELVWMRQPDWANPLSSTRLLVRDVDADGSPDIFGMDWNTIGHYPGDWERLGPAHVFRLTANGEDVWVREMDTWWSNQDIALADADGDGDVDVLVNGPGAGGDGVWRLSAKSGTAEHFMPVTPWKLLRGPVLTDLNGDNKMHILVPVQPMDGQARGAILRLALDVPFDG